MAGTGRGPRVDARFVAGVVVAVALVVFIAQNSDRVRVQWLFFDSVTRLWVVIVVTAAGTLVAERLIAAALRRRRSGSDRNDLP